MQNRLRIVLRWNGRRETYVSSRTFAVRIKLFICVHASIHFIYLKYKLNRGIESFNSFWTHIVAALTDIAVFTFEFLATDNKCFSSAFRLFSSQNERLVHSLDAPVLE